MRYSSRVAAGKCIICISMFLFSVVGMILTALITKLVFAALGWFTIGSFDIAWGDIIYAAKLGFAGGSILGLGWIIFYIFKAKGF
ncbi:hypothetical protein [Raoultella terrigena]|uniref:Uncharacterized protein n=1 Tax=Raoultella terrigena TaxID=577 RepID=A0A3P8KIR9_RAOTE|nr:hypothetical protein [Raoultella terrigena]VDR29205.1 Uncharacterised protein [Raoultella terrigena]